MAVGRDEIRDIALGLEMGGLDGWVYPYQEILIDEKQGEIVGFWKQIVNKCDGTHEVAGIGGSWFRLRRPPVVLAARLVRLRQRRRPVRQDSSAPATSADGMQKRIERSVAGEKLPGYYPLGEAPVPIW